MPGGGCSACATALPQRGGQALGRTFSGGGARRSGDRGVGRPFLVVAQQLDRLVESMPLPWPTYREHVARAVANVIVSHKPDGTGLSRLVLSAYQP